MSTLEIVNSRFDEFNDVKVKELFELRPWMVGKTFTMLTQTIEIEKYIDICIEKGLCSLDLEATSLNTRLNENGESCAKIVGVCLAHNADEGIYIPVAHYDKEFNVSLKFIIRELARLTANCRCIFHNFKYDGQVLRNHGIIIEDEDRYEDTLLMAAVEDASRKGKGLKELCEKLLGRQMIEIDELGADSGSKKRVVAFDMVPPQIALYYGGSDGMCTFALYEYLKKKLDEQDPTTKKGPWTIYKIEKRCLFVTMEMERNMAKIDRSYLLKCREDVIGKIQKLIKSIHELAGRDFDINSPKQLGIVLFEEMKIPYPVKEKTATNQYITNEKVLEKLEGKYPIIDMILTYRGLGKILETYIENFLRNADANDEVKFNLNQVQADTGRFSSSGGAGLETDGYSGVNCQNIPNYDAKNPNSVDLRRAVVARPGYKIVSIDYSGEELRIAANFSREPLWIKEFCEGTGDLHSITARIIYKNPEIEDCAKWKKERGTGKTLNFLTLYGGGAGGFSTKAKVPYETAKKMIINFFEEYKGLKQWIDRESAAARKRGYSLTAFGRRRPLHMFYSSPEKKDQAFADRCAINSAIQGTGADILKIALFRIWKWIRNSGLQDDVRILAPVHDEVVFEVKEDKIEALIPEMCNIMCLPDVTKALGWPVRLTVDAEYGDSFHVDHNYWKEHKKEKEKSLNPQPPVTEAIPAPANVPVSDDTPKVSEETTPPLKQNPEEPVVSQERQEASVIEAATMEPASSTSSQNSAVCASTSNTGSSQYYVNVTVKSTLTDGVSEKEDIKNILKDNNGSSNSLVALQDAHIKDRIDPRGYFNYPIEIDSVSAHRLRFILDILTKAGDRVFVGPKYKICALSKDGEVYYRSAEAVHIDAFLALCLMFNI